MARGLPTCLHLSSSLSPAFHSLPYGSLASVSFLSPSLVRKELENKSLLRGVCWISTSKGNGSILWRFMYHLSFSRSYRSRTWVAQYASDNDNGKTAFNDVDQCLSALEELDSLLLHASRNEPDATVKSVIAKISASINALDSLLQTVPSDVLSKGKIIDDSYRSMEDEDPASLGPELTQLEEIL